MHRTYKYIGADAYVANGIDLDRIYESEVDPVGVHINLRVIDANEAARHVAPIPNMRHAKMTGLDQCFKTLDQFCSPVISAGIDKCMLIFDIGSCPMKHICEAYRNSKSKNPVSTVMRSEFKIGELSFKEESYFVNVFTNRNEGRLQVQTVFGEVFTPDIFRENLHQHVVLKMKMRPTCTIGLGGVGKDAESRGCYRTMTWKDNEMHYSASLPTDKLEDMGGIHAAFKFALFNGEVCEAVVSDTDWILAALASVSKHVYDRSFGTMYVRSYPKKNVPYSIININQGVMSINNHPSLFFMEQKWRVSWVVAVSIALGSDTTSSFRGLSSNTGLVCAIKHASIIGHFVREATEEERISHGFTVVLDFNVYLRLLIILHIEVTPSLLCDAWKNKSLPEKERLIQEVGWCGNFLQILGKQHIPDVCSFGLSEPNCRFALGRIMCRFWDYYMADIIQAPPTRYLGFTMTVKTEDGQETTLDEPWRNDPLFKKFMSTKPKFLQDEKGRPFNMKMAEVFPDGGAKEALLKKSAQHLRSSVCKSLRRCGRCRHACHGKVQCIACGVEPCVEVCKKCLHIAHGGVVCSICEPLMLDKRSKCVDHCHDCKHAGTKDNHASNGCNSCELGQGCNLVAASIAVDGDIDDNEVADPLAIPMRTGDDEKNDSADKDENQRGDSRSEQLLLLLSSFDINDDFFNLAVEKVDDATDSHDLDAVLREFLSD